MTQWSPEPEIDHAVEIDHGNKIDYDYGIEP